MQSTCHSNVNIAHDCLNTRGHGIDTQNYTLEIGATVVHIVNLLFHEGIIKKQKLMSKHNVNNNRDNFFSS